MSPKTRGFSKNKHSRGKSFNNNKKRKFNINKNRSFNSKRKLKQDDDSFNDEKRPKFELPSETKVSSSSESEEEDENPLKQLLNTFEIPVSTKKITSVDTDDSESSDQDDADADDGSINEDLSESEQLSDNDETNNDNEIEINKDNSENDSDLEEDDEIDEDTLKTDLPSKDPFMQHLNYDLHEKLIDSLKNTNSKLTQHIEWPWIGKMLYSIPTCEPFETEKSNFTLEENKQYAPLGKIPTKIIQEKMDLNEIHIKSQIHKNIKPANKELSEDDVSPLTEFQCELFSIINNYQDLYFNERTFENAEEIRFVYSLHAINHILKTRTKILHHNARLQKKDDVPEEFRDQGLVRPKVLIIVPFRDSALKIVQMLMDILVPAEDGQVINKLRFMEDFSGNELILPKKNPKPEDYELTFTGNCDDTFKIGIQVTKKSLKLYADFYSSDIIIASPLGLRLTVGAEGEAERDHDFLASIELLIMDQTELFLMQNWDHLIHVLDHLHVQPKQSHGTDFSRIRTWTLNGWSRYYRQTLIFSSLQLPEINAIFNRKCNNYAGSVRTVNPIRNGSIINVHVQVPQVYKRFKIDDVLKSIEARFDFFINKILPQFRDTIMKQCLIYVPCYFDYVKIRNHFKREDISFVQICEYSENAKIARARDMFFHGDAHFMLYSERFHYFRRIRVKGIRHIIFYQPPVFPHFYSEMCNFMQEAFQNKKCGSASNMTVTVIYSKYDYQRLAPILGSERLAKMATSENNFHMFTSTDR